MGNSVFNTMQVTTESDDTGMALVAAKAVELGLVTTGVVALPINRYYWLAVLPSGSKDARDDEYAHLARLNALAKYIESYNNECGCRYLMAVHLRVLDNGMGDELVNVMYSTPDAIEN